MSKHPLQVWESLQERDVTTPPSLESVLLELARYGEPRLCLMGTDWHCSVEMYTTAVGAKFQVKSEFRDLPSPMAAAQQCLKRVRAVMTA